MRFPFLLIIVVLLAACSTRQFMTGERYEEDNPSFVLSVAPSFYAPYEYELSSNVLTLREYSGLGGYDWGVVSSTTQSKLTTQQEVTLRELSLEVIEDAIDDEKDGIDVIVMDGTRCYIMTNFGFGPFLSISTNNPPNSIHGLEEYLQKILGIEK